MTPMGYEHLLIFGGAAVVAWFLVIYFWPLMLLYMYKRDVLVKEEATVPSRSIRSIRCPKRFLQIPSTHPTPLPQNF